MKTITVNGLNFSDLHSVNYDKGFINTIDCTRLEPEQIEELERVCEFEIVESGLRGWDGWTHIIRATEPETHSAYYYLAR